MLLCMGGGGGSSTPGGPGGPPRGRNGRKESRFRGIFGFNRLWTSRVEFLTHINGRAVDLKLRTCEIRSAGKNGKLSRSTVKGVRFVDVTFDGICAESKEGFKTDSVASELTFECR